MTIETRANAVKRLMDRILNYSRLIEADDFESGTIEDMQGNAKDLCDAAKSEIDNIKAEIGQWS